MNGNMEESEKPILRLGSQAAGPEAGFTIGAYSRKLALAIAASIRPTYSGGLHLLGVTLRIDSGANAFGPPGPEPAIWSSVEKSLRLDCVVAESVWKGKSHLEVRQNFIALMDEAVESLLHLGRETGIDFDYEHFRQDWQNTKKIYLDLTVDEPERGFRLPSGKWVNPQGGRPN